MNDSYPGTGPADPWALERFVQAQDAGGTLDRALAELRAGRKTSHWMWFVFPQLAGLGRSPTARHFAVSGLGEARAYLAHPLLGPRLRLACEAVLGLSTASAVEVLGQLDAQKLHSSMTLFALADTEGSIFDAVLERFFDGRYDATEGLLAE